MQRGLIISALLHVSVFAAAYIGLPSMFRPEIVVTAPPVVDLVKELPEKPPEKKPEPAETGTEKDRAASGRESPCYSGSLLLFPSRRRYRRQRPRPNRRRPR